MKKYIVFLSLLFSTAFAFAVQPPYSHMQEYERVKKDFIQKIISKEQVTCMLCVHRDTTLKYLDEETAKSIVLDSIYNWTDKVKNTIIENKMQEFFSDILDMIDALDINIIPCKVNEQDKIVPDEADMLIFFVEDMQKHTNIELPNGAFGAFINETGDIFINTLPQHKYKNYVAELSHELGHAFGLADQYSGAIYRGSFIYNSKVRRPSIMDSRNTKKITCDDVDGFITSVDRINDTHRSFYSLCGDGIFIEEGKGKAGTDAIYEFYENFDYFDANIKVSYTAQENNGYIVDIVLDKFIIGDIGLHILRDMGFEVDRLKEVKQGVVRIHGAIAEEPSEDEFKSHMKTPKDLWTFVLYKKNMFKEIPLQIVTIEFSVPENAPIFTDLNTDSSRYINKKLSIPFINYFPAPGLGHKEVARIKYMLRINSAGPKQKEIGNSSFANGPSESAGKIMGNFQK